VPDVLEIPLEVPSEMQNRVRVQPFVVQTQPMNLNRWDHGFD
jgi:hypothetical protein